MDSCHALSNSNWYSWLSYIWVAKHFFQVPDQFDQFHPPGWIQQSYTWKLGVSKSTMKALDRLTISELKTTRNLLFRKQCPHFVSTFYPQSFSMCNKPLADSTDNAAGVDSDVFAGEGVTWPWGYCEKAVPISLHLHSFPLSSFTCMQTRLIAAESHLWDKAIL